MACKRTRLRAHLCGSPRLCQDFKGRLLDSDGTPFFISQSRTLLLFLLGQNLTRESKGTWLQNLSMKGDLSTYEIGSMLHHSPAGCGSPEGRLGRRRPRTWVYVAKTKRRGLEKGGKEQNTDFHSHFEQMNSGIPHPFQSPPLHSGEHGGGSRAGRGSRRVHGRQPAGRGRLPRAAPPHEDAAGGRARPPGPRAPGPWPRQFVKHVCRSNGYSWKFVEVFRAGVWVWIGMHITAQTCSYGNSAVKGRKARSRSGPAGGHSAGWIQTFVEYG